MTNPTAPLMYEDVVSVPKDETSIVVNIGVTGTELVSSVNLMTQQYVNDTEGAEAAKDVVNDIEDVTKTLEVVAVDSVEEQNDVEQALTNAGKTLPIQDTNKLDDGAKAHVSGTFLVLSVNLLSLEDVKINELLHKDAALTPASSLSLVVQKNVNAVDAKDVAEDIEDVTKMLDAVAVDSDEEKNDVEEAAVDSDETFPTENTDKQDDVETRL